jgi:uncharacterized protein
MRFMGCQHATALDLAYLQGAPLTPGADTEDAELLQRQGNAHEARHLQALKDQGRCVVEISKGGSLAEGAARTRKVLSDGPDVVFQGAFLSGRWGGWSDFLERVERPSRLGSFSYEVTDTKLKRRPHPKHVLQLTLYSDLLAQVQGTAPERAHVELGDGSRASFRLAEYAHYACGARERLEAFVARPPATRPVPCADCTLCRWADHCGEEWRRTDSLFNVAGITKGQVKKLEAGGTGTMAALAAGTGSIRGLAVPTLEKLRAQARLQHARKSGAPDFELRPPEAGKGFDLMPAPDPGDLFYDIEGDPHFEGGLEYLHGVWFDGAFKAFWAHDHASEARQLQALLDFFRDRLTRFPGTRIYHYAAYEITALRRLTAKYGIGEAFLDRLLRERRFVDLFSVVRGALIASEPNYSIKSMEAFYGLKRSGEVKTAGGSVVAYEKWRETQEQAILDEIEEYNRMDCQSTELLRDWLARIRPGGPWPVLGESAADKEETEDGDVTAFRARLDASGLPEGQRDILFNLGQFHKRELKPAWWAIFDSLGRETEELIDDLDALGGLTATGPAVPVKRSMARTYAYPAQETKLRKGKGATIPTPDGFVAVTVEDMDRQKRTITLKLGKAKSHLLAEQLTLHPAKPIDPEVIALAVRDVIRDQMEGGRYRAAGDLLSRAVPGFRAPRPDVLGGQDPVEGTIEAVHAMAETVLPIQGPPGTGKTHVSARAIKSLLQAGFRVGVASNSHDAIRNVLLGCEKALGETGEAGRFYITHKISGDDEGYPPETFVRRTTDNEEAAEAPHLVGGTAYFFARDENIQRFDWLFVDEAGQVGLANMVAMARAARNVVLVGDPRQLPQVIQGAHPHPANLSCLEWMLGEHATIPPDRGIFLGTTRRLHPDICAFISDQVYEGRLHSHPLTAQQKVSGTALPEAGAWWVPVQHEGNAQISDEEVSAISETVRDLLVGRWTGQSGETRPLVHSDIIVVAPYNAQVNALREALPPDVRVGTVDKFQGQEAPVCLVSMTASSAEETARGMEFLFSLNRINVAVSRAKGLALAFGSPRLLEARCDTVEQMKLVNTLCALPQLTTGDVS